MAVSAMFQKKPTASAVHPMTGTPGCVFLIAGSANKRPAPTA